MRLLPPPLDSGFPSQNYIMKVFELMHKNDVAALMQMTDDGRLITKVKKINPELIPLQGNLSRNGLNDWWSDRAVPTRQDGSRLLLDQAHASSPKEFLMINLALSLTDCYWVRPENTDFSWADVNLYENNFGNMPAASAQEALENMVFVPSSSTVGELKKRWFIFNGDRYLVKGNAINYYQQSLNEVMASCIHKKQGFGNYVKYTPIRLDVLGEEGVGCICKNFTSPQQEFIAAIQIVDSEPKKTEVNWFDHYLDVCEKHGLIRDELQAFMDYMLETDFLLTNTDRHLNNFGVLRDTETLQFTSPAPIFDTGNCLAYKGRITDPCDVKIASFYDTEKTQISFIKGKDAVDLSKLPSDKEVYDIYSQDEHYESYIDNVLEVLEHKKKMLSDLQSGLTVDEIYDNQQIRTNSGRVSVPGFKSAVKKLNKKSSSNKKTGR